jgi:GT2 family glycosyltransferase
MRFSIVIPTYNSARHIYKNLTILAEYIQDVVEIIVVDDGSTDDTVDEVKEFIKDSERRNIKIIEMEHTSPAYERNVGWNEAKGDIVIFLDSDCLVTENWFDEMIKPFKEKDVIAVSGVYLSNQKKFISRYIQEQVKYRQDKIKKYTDNLATYSLAVRKKFLEMVNGFPEDYPSASCEDTEFSYRLRKYGKFVINEKAKVYHQHDESITKYLKKQFNHAKFRVLMFKRGNPVGDKYAGLEIMIQPLLAFISIFYPLNNFFVLFFGGLIALQVVETKSILEDFRFYFFSIIIGIIRAYVWLAGIIWGFVEFYV